MTDKFWSKLSYCELQRQKTQYVIIKYFWVQLINKNYLKKLHAHENDYASIKTCRNEGFREYETYKIYPLGMYFILIQ